MRWRMVIRVLLLGGLLVFGGLIYTDRPGGSPPPIPALGGGGGRFYTQSVWLGVAHQGDFAQGGFSVGPTLFVTPNSTGWSGRLVFELGGVTSTDLEGTFVLILPNHSSVDVSSQTGLVESSVSHGFSRKLYYLRISPSVSLGSTLNADLPIAWKTKQLHQRLGFGSDQYELIISNAYRTAHGIYADLPFVSHEELSSSGEPTEDTPAAAITVALPAGETLSQMTPASDVGYQLPGGASWRMAPADATLQPETFTGRVIVVTAQNTTDQFLYEVASGIGFAVFGFVLAELVPVVDDVRKWRDRRRAGFRA